MRKLFYVIIGILLMTMAFAQIDVTTSGSRPTIVVTFSEPINMTTVDVKLEKVSGGTEVPLVLEDHNSIYTYLVYRPSTELEEESYKFSISADNVFGLPGDEQVIEFDVSYVDMDLWLVEPSFGVSGNDTFDVVVQTGRVSECKWSNIGWPKEDGFNSRGEPFNQTNDFFHTQHDYEIDGDEQRFYAFCKDDITETIYRGDFILYYDGVEPDITDLYTNYPNDIITDSVFDLFLYADTDKDAQCWWSQDENFDTEYIFDSGYTTESSTEIPSLAIDEGTTTIYVRCKGKSGLMSAEEVIDIELDPSLALTIRRNTPNYVSDNFAYLNVTLNKRTAACAYFHDSDYQDYWGSMSRQGDTMDYVKRVTLSDDGSYSFYVECEDEFNYKASVAITVTYDKLPPEMVEVELIPPNDIDDPTKTYHDDRLNVRFIAEENASTISRFNYYIVRKLFSGDTIVDSGYVSNDITSIGNNQYRFTGWLHDLPLNDSSKYAVMANAVDGSGHVSDNMTSNNTLTVDVSLYPVECDNGRQDGTESDVDCGGEECDACGVGEVCNSDDDCYSYNCGENGTCEESTCEDDIKNQDESDVDCGGSCDKCEIGKDCDNDNDCLSGNCDAATNKCEAAENTCINGIKDNGETDVDCGGPCDKCDTGQECAYGYDCVSGVCSQAGLCQSPSCSDQVENGQETDVDCGGSDCQRCEEGKKCSIDDDCVSGDCTGGRCVVPTITDADGDGMNDDWERRNGLDPSDPSDANDDNDSDELTNLVEFRIGTNPNMSDTDGDGWDDGVEYDKGTDPLDPDDHPAGFPWLLILILLILIALMAVGGYYGYQQYLEYQEKQKMKRKPMPHKPIQHAMPQRPVMRRPIPQHIPHRPMPHRPMPAKPAAQPAPKKPVDIFDKLANMSSTTAEEKAEIFARLKKMAGEDIKPVHVKKVAESKKTPKVDKLKSFNIIAEKRLSEETNKEILKNLQALTATHKQMSKRLKKVESKITGGSQIVIASKTGKMFHKPNCIVIKRIPKENIVSFKNKEEAIKKGYKPCSVCSR